MAEGDKLVTFDMAKELNTKFDNAVGNLKSALSVNAGGVPAIAPYGVKKALIQTSTGNILLRDAGILYCYEVVENTSYIVHFAGGNVHRVAVANSAFSEGLQTTIISNKSGDTLLADEDVLISTGANAYVYVQTSANVSYPGTSMLEVAEHAYLSESKYGVIGSASENLIDGKTAVPSGIGFSQGKFTSESASVSSAIDIATDYFNGPVYIYNPDQYSVAVGIYDAEKTFVAFYSPVTSATTPASDYAKDKIIYLPRLFSGYYRVTVQGYSDDVGSLGVYTPSETTVTLLTDTEPGYTIGRYSTSSGYLSGFNNILIGPVKITKNATLLIDLVDADYRYAVYSISESGTRKLETGDFITTPSVFFDDDKTYIIRVSPVDGNVSYVYDGKALYNAIGISYGRQAGYDRHYTDITYSLTRERKEINDGVITDSTTCLMIKLPSVGDVEIKVNNPMVEFCVYTYNGTAYTLAKDWTLYGFRYFGNGDNDYYAFVRYYPSASTITKFAKLIKVMIYHDEADSTPINAKLFGKKIAVMGDSVVQGRYANRSDSVTDVLVKPWSAIIGESTGKDADNYGIGGATVAEAGDTWKSLYANRSKVSGYDVVFVCAGINDCANNVTESDFKSAYQAVIDALVTNNSEVVLVTPTSRKTENANTIGLALSDYAGFVKDLATTNSLQLLDLYSHTKFNMQYKSALPDNLHPDAVGHKIIADFIVNEYA